jgi:hypothetical protein
MLPTDLDVRALYCEKLREAEVHGRINEAPRLAALSGARERTAKRGRHSTPLGWLLRVVLRAGPV